MALPWAGLCSAFSTYRIWVVAGFLMILLSMILPILARIQIVLPNPAEPEPNKMINRERTQGTQEIKS